MTLVLSSLATPQPQPRVITARASDSAGEAASPVSRRTVARTSEGGGGARGAGAGARRLAGMSGRAAEAIAHLGQRLTPRCGPRAYPRCREIVFRGSFTRTAPAGEHVFVPESGDTPPPRGGVCVRCCS